MYINKYSRRLLVASGGAKVSVRGDPVGGRDNRALCMRCRGAYIERATHTHVYLYLYNEIAR